MWSVKMCLMQGIWLYIREGTMGKGTCEGSLSDQQDGYGMEGNADADPDQGHPGWGSSSLVHPGLLSIRSPTSRSCQSSVAWGGDGAGLGSGGGALESIFWPRGLDWPATPTCSAAERGRVTPSGSASPASGEVRASPLPLQRFVARLSLQGRGGGPAARTGE